MFERRARRTLRSGILDRPVIRTQGVARMALNECCRGEAEASLKRHQDVARCDVCGSLLLAYADEETFRLMVDEMQSKGADFATDRLSSLYVVAKAP